MADGVTVRSVWLTWKIAPLALFAVIWDSFLFFWYSQALSKPNAPLMMILFPIGHVAVGLGITYYLLASLVNKTDVIVSSSGVTVVTGPAPWIGNKVVKADDITQVLVRERAGNRNSRTYAVMYADRNRKEKNLVRSLAESDQAEFIALVIRRTLNLAPVT
jgi:hypothetical protein